MKEAAGEANMTVITIVLIAIVLAVGTVIIRGVMQNTRNQSACTSCGGYWKGGKCQISANNTTNVDYSACKNSNLDNDIAQ